MAISLQSAIQWAVDTCYREDVGYSQSYRNEQTVNGITYYDCSSFIWYSLKAGGFDVVTAYNNALWTYSGNAVTTAYLEEWLLELGFVEIPISNEWLQGDILWRSGHTEMVYSGRRTMGAHSSSYDLEDQVSINTYEASVSSWSKCFRYETSSPTTPTEWIQGGTSEYFTRSKMENNAICIYNFFIRRGWTIQAIAGLLGNIQQESTFNPNLIEIGGTGHGLVQWTPPSNLYDVLDVLYGSHDDWYLGDKQCNVIYAEYEEACGFADRGIEKQWYETSTYPMSWLEWSKSTGDVGTLALVFQRNYERPASIHPERYDYAHEWYEFLKTLTPYDPTPASIKKSNFKFYLYANRRRKTWKNKHL